MQTMVGDDGARGISATAKRAQVLQDISAAVRAHWGVEDPAKAEGTDAEIDISDCVEDHIE